MLKWDNKRVNQAPRFGYGKEEEEEEEEELRDELTDEWDFDVCSTQTIQHTEHEIQYNYLTHPS